MHFASFRPNWGCKRLKCHKCKWRCGGCCRAAAQTQTWPCWPCWPCRRDRGDRHRGVDRPWSCGTSCGCWPRPRQGLMAAWCGYGGGRGPHQVDSHHVSSEGLHQAVSKPGAERLLRGFVMVICEFLKLGLPSVLDLSTNFVGGSGGSRQLPKPVATDLWNINNWRFSWPTLSSSSIAWWGAPDDRRNRDCNS